MAPILKQLTNSVKFSSLENLTSFYESKQPTPKKVVKLLFGAPSNDAERQTLDFLKKFVKNLSEAQTCGPVLEVPSTYQSFNELVEECNSVLSNRESWTFHIV